MDDPQLPDYNGGLKVWEVVTGRELLAVPPERLPPLNGGAFLPCGTALALLQDELADRAGLFETLERVESSFRQIPQAGTGFPDWEELNGLAFADVDHAQMSRASTMSTMGQQLSQSIGIGMAATFLHLSMVAQHAKHLTAGIIGPAFIAVGFVSLISMLYFLALPADAGAELHGPARARAGR